MLLNYCLRAVQCSAVCVCICTISYKSSNYDSRDWTTDRMNQSSWRARGVPLLSMIEDTAAH